MAGYLLGKAFPDTSANIIPLLPFYPASFFLIVLITIWHFILRVCVQLLSISLLECKLQGVGILSLPHHWNIELPLI